MAESKTIGGSVLKIALIVGAGFSVEAGVPSTNRLARRFLTDPEGTSGVVDDAITEALTTFWRKVFGASGDTQPTLEEHFTVLDLAANSGHHLGRAYPPRKLRAIRRLSIHRTFQVLDRNYRHSTAIATLLQRLSKVDRTLSLVSLNWDIVAEKHLDVLRAEYKYDIDVRYIDGERIERGPIRLYKMHGSSNWLYCDSCRQLYAPRDQGKAALNLNAYLEPHDFEALGFPEAARFVKRQTRDPRKCAWCHNRLAGRLATFSYRKAFSINQFQTIWDRAYSALARADRWLFIGYSMPEADFEFKHLLKAAQLARPQSSKLSMRAVVKGDEDARNRYRAYFGTQIGAISQIGLEKWVETELTDWIKKGS